jgi:hypothetical protein
MILKIRKWQPILMVNESNLPQGEFVAKFGGEPGTGRKGLGARWFVQNKVLFKSYWRLLR